MAHQFSSLTFHLGSELFVDFKTLKKHGLQAVREETHCELHVLAEALPDKDIALWQIAVKHEVKLVRVD